MRLLLMLSIVLFTSCQKNFEHGANTTISTTVSTDVTAPLPCHSTEFKSGYPYRVGTVPPFAFQKTLYSDTRVKSVKLASRGAANMADVTQIYYRYDYTITYGVRHAILKGSRRKIQVPGFATSTDTFTYRVNFNQAGYCVSMRIVYRDPQRDILKFEYNTSNMLKTFRVGEVDSIGVYNVVNDTRGNIVRMYNFFAPKRFNEVVYTYDLSKPANTIQYEPMQALVPTGNGDFITFLHSMQWLPLPKHQRKTASQTYRIRNKDGSVTNLVESKQYLNHKYDAAKNLTSYTYQDNVPHTISWYCK